MCGIAGFVSADAGCQKCMHQHQPVTGCDHQQATIVFNGEIYNYRELQARIGLKVERADMGLIRECDESRKS
jgi:asparagine synthetase B (glutamine-hydrolysing)